MLTVTEKQRNNKNIATMGIATCMIKTKLNRRTAGGQRLLRQWIVVGSLLILLLFALSAVHVAAEEEQVTWTPNDDDADGSNPSLPLSMKQRKQLLQLQQTIMQSEDPNAVIQQVAQSNGMSPSDLVNMLEKNARDLQADPTLLDPVMLPQLAMKTFMGGLGVVGSIARKHPRTFSLTVTTVLVLLYLTTIVIPQTGLQISNSRNILSPNGPTTVWTPPEEYIQTLLLKNEKNEYDDDTNAYDDEEDPMSNTARNDHQQVISSKFTAMADEVILEGVDIDDEQRDEITHMLYINGRKAMVDRKLTEFASSAADYDSSGSTSSLRCVVSDDDIDRGILIVPRLGDFGFNGLVFWKVTDEQDTMVTGDSTTAASSLKLSTVNGMSAFDGYIRISVRHVVDDDVTIDAEVVSEDDEEDDDNAPSLSSKSMGIGVKFQVQLVVPKNGVRKYRRISKRLGQKITDQIASSLRQSSIQTTRQTLVRRKQGRRFQQSGAKRASDRRHIRFDREKLLEEMAEDRRRKWQRRNPDAGRYRPSGHRQRSPNNC